MVEDAVHAHLLLQTVERLRRHTLQQRVGFARYLHTIDDVVAGLEVVDHLRNTRPVIVLEVSIEGDDGISPVLGSHHPGHDGILMPHVVCKVDAPYAWIPAVKTGDDFPCTVAAAVIDEHDHRVVRNLFLPDQLFEESRKMIRRLFQDLFLIVTRRDCCKFYHICILPFGDNCSANSHPYFVCLALSFQAKSACRRVPSRMRRGPISSDG